MGKLLFELSDDDRAALERVRIKMGLRSHAETLRALISEADGGVALAVGDPPPRPAPSGAVVAGRSKTTLTPAAPRPIVSRLKGEWKPK